MFAPSLETCSDKLQKVDEIKSKVEIENKRMRECELENARLHSLIIRLQKEKEALEHSIKAEQVQKEFFDDETNKIQDFQQQEIEKLKSMLLFREQAALAHLQKSQQSEIKVIWLSDYRRSIRSKHLAGDKLVD